jgi:hypothetical protein
LVLIGGTTTVTGGGGGGGGGGTITVDPDFFEQAINSTININSIHVG